MIFFEVKGNCLTGTQICAFNTRATRIDAARFSFSRKETIAQIDTTTKMITPNEIVMIDITYLPPRINLEISTQLERNWMYSPDSCKDYSFLPMHLSCLLLNRSKREHHTPCFRLHAPTASGGTNSA